MNDNIAFIGLGSNLDGPVTHVEQAIDQLANCAEIYLAKQSKLYQSQPVGPQDQPDFINAVIMIHTNLNPLDLLDIMQDIENKHDRKRLVRWGARTLDLDLLLYNDQIINNARLTVPHPEIPNRAFVLVPLQELNSDLEIPGIGLLSDLINNVDQSSINELSNHE